MTLQEKKRTKKISKTIKVNIERRTVIVDDKLVFYKNIPIPSWIELSIIDVCNRSCAFCPKSDPKIAPTEIPIIIMKGSTTFTNVMLTAINIASADKKLPLTAVSSLPSIFMPVINNIEDIM